MTAEAAGEARRRASLSVSGHLGGEPIVSPEATALYAGSQLKLPVKRPSTKPI
jgi:hypothetical protein